MHRYQWFVSLVGSVYKLSIQAAVILQNNNAYCADVYLHHNVQLLAPTLYLNMMIIIVIGNVSRSIPQYGNRSEIFLKVLHRNFMGGDEFLGQLTLPLQDFDVYEKPKAR